MMDEMNGYCWRAGRKILRQVGIEQELKLDQTLHSEKYTTRIAGQRHIEKVHHVDSRDTSSVLICMYDI